MHLLKPILLINKVNRSKMKQKSENKQAPAEKAASEKTNTPDGYPIYPENEDIYIVGKKEEDINLDDLSKKKRKIDVEEKNPANEKGFEDDKSGDDLDIPGAELDDDQEEIGSEDEENNYYSLGGDDHNDLEEDRS